MIPWKIIEDRHILIVYITFSFFITLCHFGRDTNIWKLKWIWRYLGLILMEYTFNLSGVLFNIKRKRIRLRTYSKWFFILSQVICFQHIFPDIAILMIIRHVNFFYDLVILSQLKWLEALPCFVYNIYPLGYMCPLNLMSWYIADKNAVTFLPVSYCNIPCLTLCPPPI